MLNYIKISSLSFILVWVSVNTYAQEKRISIVKPKKYFSLNLGADLNTKISEFGWHIKGIVPTHKILDLTVHYSRFNGEKAVENYIGFGTHINIVHRQRFRLSPHFTLEYNLWKNHFLYLNPAAREQKNVLVSPGLWSEYNIGKVKIGFNALYNIIWNEIRCQATLGYNFLDLKVKKL